MSTSMLDWIKSRRPATRVLMIGVPLLVISFVGVNVYPYQAPEQLWTQDDLPSTANEADNGWMVVTAAHHGEIPQELLLLLNPEDHDAAQFWQRVDQQAEGLREFMASDDARAATERVDAARKAPVFVEDDCTFDRSCTTFAWLWQHRVATLRAIDLAARGELANSLELLRDLIRMDASHLASARSLISTLTAIANLQDAMTIADMIAQRDASSAEATSPAAKAALAELAPVVQSVDVEAVSLEKAVISEYLGQIQFLDMLEAESTGLDRLLFSRALTLRIINPRFEHRHRQAVAHDTVGALGGGELSPKQELGWWVRNSVGKTLLDTTAVIAESMAADLDEGLAALAKTRALLLARPGLQAP